MAIEDDCTPMPPCVQPGCCKPFNCPCTDGEPCHFPALERNVKALRNELEMPPRE